MGAEAMAGGCREQVGIKGQPFLIDDELINTVKTDDSLWEIDSVNGKRYDPCSVSSVQPRQPHGSL
jgi:hypothetical protein